MSKVKFNITNPIKLLKSFEWRKIPTDFKMWTAFVIGIFVILAIYDIFFG